MIVRKDIINFAPICNKLKEIAALERKVGGAVDTMESNLVAGEGNEGTIRDEPNNHDAAQENAVNASSDQFRKGAHQVAEAFHSACR
ncbi:MAG: hypothetical protein R3C09_18775 [Pirellulaceae bacterium]